MQAAEPSTNVQEALVEGTCAESSAAQNSQKRSEYSPPNSSSDDDETVDATPPRRKRYKSLCVPALIFCSGACLPALAF